MAKEDDYSWLVAPLIGVAGLIGAFLFSNATSTNNNSNNSNNLPSLPPPPAGQKPSGCGCQKG